MLAKVCILLLIASVKTVENGPTKITEFHHVNQSPLDYSEHVEKRETYPLPPENEQAETQKQVQNIIPANQSGNQDANNVKPLQNDINLQNNINLPQNDPKPSQNEPKPLQNDVSQQQNKVNTQIDLLTGQSEGGTLKVDSPPPQKAEENINNSQTKTKELAKDNPNASDTASVVNAKNHTTNATGIVDALSTTNSGVVKRGLIVFGGFALLATAYFIFYRKKNKNYESNNAHGNSDANQFRYGVLQSDDRRDNLELSRIPLTMESDEEDEDDLEIFDLEQKKKSLSYVNLQTNDEDIVLHSSSKDESKNNLLLDIEDGPSDTLINWSSNGNKSIL